MMKTTKLLCFLFCLGLMSPFVFIRQAEAALGKSTDSLASDRKALTTVRSVKKTFSNYNVQELQSKTKNVREYVSPSGVVFGIAWDGISHPDLTPLLGNYASEHKKAEANFRRQHGLRHARIKTSNIVVEKWGHMRRVRGRAYVPALIPEGVSVDEIK
jgi:hypothetical protein